MLLVTGGGGRIGLRLRDRIEAAGLPASYVVSPRAVAVDDPMVDIADVTDSDRMRHIVATRAPTAIIHLASITGGACEADPQRARAVNVEAARDLAATAAELGVSRFVLASTAAVYGDKYDRPASENAPLVLTSEYAKSKRAAEQALEQLASGPLSAVALRIFNVYGPGMVDSLANRLIRASDASPVNLAGLDSFVRDYIHVDDVADALLIAARAPVDQPFLVTNIASGVPTSNRALVAALEPVFFSVGDPMSSYSCADVSRARELLGFVATRALARSNVE